MELILENGLILLLNFVKFKKEDDKDKSWDRSKVKGKETNKNKQRREKKIFEWL